MLDHPQILFRKRFLNTYLRKVSSAGDEEAGRRGRSSEPPRCSQRPKPVKLTAL